MVPAALRSASLLVFLAAALPAFAQLDARAMARAFPKGGLAPRAASDVQVAEARQLAAKALGDDVRDLVFVPVTPCTVWDTRFATEPQSAGAIANGTTKRFYSHDGAAGNYATWGGNPSCPETLEAAIGGHPFAVMMTVYISDASANGWLTLYRDGDADPSLATISVYYSPGPTRTQTVIAKSSRGYGTGVFDVAATSRFGSVNASASVTGYFLKPVNVTLPNSTASTGNVLKGADRFIHNAGFDNTFVGVNAGNFTPPGQGSVALGTSALSGAASSAEGNVAVGAGALAGSVSGSYNTAVGRAALANYTGSYSTAMGSTALVASTAGPNTAVGAATLWQNATGTTNTAVGYFSLASNLGGSANTTLGHATLIQATGSSNIAVGHNAGFNILAGEHNIHIANNGDALDDHTLRLGAVQSRAFVAGIRGVTTGMNDAVAVVVDSNGQLGTVSSSRAAKDDIEDMNEASARLMRLRPVTFRYKSHKAAGQLEPHFGLVAEEVAEQMPELVARGPGGRAETVYYQFLPPMLLNEYQKQQRTIDALRDELAELRREMNLLKKGAAP